MKSEKQEINWFDFHKLTIPQGPCYLKKNKKWKTLSALSSKIDEYPNCGGVVFFGANECSSNNFSATFGLVSVTAKLYSR